MCREPTGHSVAMNRNRCSRVFALLLAAAWLAFVSGCVRLPSTGVTSLKPRSLQELQGYLLSHKADVELFRLRGPFGVAIQEARELRLTSGEAITADLYLASPKEKAALVILLHGLNNTTRDHAYQALHLASWGLHCLTLQVPNNGPWLDNGRLLAQVSRAIRSRPDIIDPRIDASKIVLAGHSFGGFAVAVALADGAGAVGGILMDPAVAETGLPSALRQISVPVIVLGADESLTSTVNRDYFFRFIRGGVAEMSIRDAVHEDAQYPAKAYGLDAFSREEWQIAFVSALTAAAFSLSATGKLDYAWSSFDNAFKNNKFFNPRRK